MMMPDKTNIGTASRGKESSPPNMARIRYLAPTVKDGSKNGRENRGDTERDRYRDRDDKQHDKDNK